MVVHCYDIFQSEFDKKAHCPYSKKVNLFNIETVQDFYINKNLKTNADSYHIS